VYQVAEDHLRTERVREKIYKISSSETTTAVRQMTFTGKVVHSGFKCPVRKLWTACRGSIRKKGRPQMHLKDSIVKIFANCSKIFQRSKSTKHVSMKDWVKEASNKSYWT
jgi:hypothetical protein